MNVHTPERCCLSAGANQNSFSKVGVRSLNSIHVSEIKEKRIKKREHEREREGGNLETYATSRPKIL